MDVALPPGRRSDALWAGGRGVGTTTSTSRRLRSVFFKRTKHIHSTFDVGRSMFDVHQFLFRLNWQLFMPAAGLTPETYFCLAIRKHLEPKRPHRPSGGGGVDLGRTHAEFFRQYLGHQTLAGLTLTKSHPGPSDPFDAV